MRELRERERELGERIRHFDCVVSSRGQIKFQFFFLFFTVTYIDRFAKDAVDVVRDGGSTGPAGRIGGEGLHCLADWFSEREKRVTLNGKQ